MERFNLEEYLANPERKVVTRDGNPVRIICTDCNNLYPVVFIAQKEDGKEGVFVAKESGICSSGVKECKFDLFFAPQKQSRWVFLYKSATDRIVSFLCYDKTEAEHKMQECYGFALTEITWEE